MSFNSPQFLVFFPVVAAVALVLRGGPRRAWLLAASYLFYASWDWRYLGLIVFSTAVDYAVGRLLGRAGGAWDRRAVRQTLLGVSLTANLGLLAYFKYHNFFLAAAADLTGEASWAGWSHRWLLPVGISFYTFQTLSYTVDVYRRAMPAEPDPVRFALYVGFFPQLVAGPIVRAADFLPQLRRDPGGAAPGDPAAAARRVRSGLALMGTGLVKKVLFADLLAGLGVDAVFADPAAHSAGDLLLALYGYAFQIYFDFSGYSDVAVGAARVLGFELPENFRRPYLAASPGEFWRRWHITLSTWLRDYLYIPLGGSRGGRWFTRRNLMVTMVLGGLWHGAAYNFLLWGVWHGALLVLSPRGGRTETLAGWRRAGGVLLTFHLVLIGWLLFRVPRLADLAVWWDVLSAGASGGGWGPTLDPAFAGLVAASAAAHLIPKAAAERGRAAVAGLPAPISGAVAAGLLVILLAGTIGSPAFIYFQF